MIPKVASPIKNKVNEMQDANILVLASPSNCQTFFTDEVIHCSNVEQLSVLLTKAIFIELVQFRTKTDEVL